MAFKIKAGVVWVNSHNLFDAAAGFGGYKESGYGRESGKEGLYEYVKLKSQSDTLYQLTDEEKSAPWGEEVFTAPRPLGSYNSESNGSQVDKTTKMFYGGKQARPDGEYTRVIVNAKNEKCGEVPEGNRKDIRNAVECAASAKGGWGSRAAYNRAQILYYLAENVDRRSKEFAERLNQMTGVGMEAAELEVAQSVERLFHWAAYSDKFGGEVKETTLYGATVSVHEPVGVIGIACPDEKPLLSFVSLFAPAVVRGNVVVIIPSEKYPLVAADLYQVFETSDVPPGVINVITGARDLLTKALATHMEVNALWYFGSKVGSYHVEKESACNLKRTLVNYGEVRDWTQPHGFEFLYHSTQVKNIWLPAGV